MQSTKPLPAMFKKVLIGLGLVCVFCIMATVTVLILKAVIPTDSAEPATVAAKSVDTVMEAFAKPDAVNGLAPTLYTSSPSTQTPVQINHKSSGHEYSIGVPVVKSMVFTSLQSNQPDDTETIHAETRTLMAKFGLSKIDSIMTSTRQKQPVMTFANTATVCQLTSSPTDLQAQLLRVHQFACTSLATIDTEYLVVDDLLELYRKNASLASFTHVTRFTQTEGDKSYSHLMLFDNTTQQHSLLFASIGDTPEYLGDFQTADEKYSNGKYSVSPEMLLAISDPKYGTFLTKIFTNQRIE